MTERRRAEPFLRWPGGKRALVERLAAMAPRRRGTYHEPFLGGGALFFRLAPRRAVLSDASERVVRAHRAVRDDLGGLLRELARRLPPGHAPTRDEFERARAEPADAGTDAELAAWLIYLNRSCFNGLYRVNRGGRFNVPFGGLRSPPSEEQLRACSRALRRAELVHGDFAAVLAAAGEGDFAYLDPPYDSPAGGPPTFVGYTAEGFGTRDQERVRDAALEMAARGGRVLVSNALTPRVLELYRVGFELDALRAPRSIGGRAARRAPAFEVLAFAGYRPPAHAAPRRSRATDELQRALPLEGLEG